MRFAVSHATSYEYQCGVSLSQHLMRLRPRATPRQNLFKYELQVEPGSKDSFEYLDYHGNPTLFLTVEGPHSRFLTRSQFEIEITPPARIPPSETPAWERVRDQARGMQQGAALAASEFLFDSPLIKSSEAFADYAWPSFTKSRPILEAALELTARIYEEFTFDSTATDVTTPIAKALKEKRGVCQDFAQVQIACFRSIGLPARYISGYINTSPPPGQPKLAGTDASHAWVSMYCPGLGWFDLDPTNNLIPTVEHITVAWGRDYSDISPVRGVTLGSGGHALKVTVDVQPID